MRAAVCQAALTMPRSSFFSRIIRQPKTSNLVLVCGSEFVVFDVQYVFGSNHFSGLIHLAVEKEL